MRNQNSYLGKVVQITPIRRRWAGKGRITKVTQWPESIRATTDHSEERFKEYPDRIYG
jgi:hypothetical protein